MKVLIINSVCGIGSTGRICTDLARSFETSGDEAKIAYGRVGAVPENFKKYSVRIGTDFDVKLHAVYTRITDKHGFGSKIATKKFLKWANEYNPDLLWLHNLHGYYINIEMLFDWIKSRPNMEVRWTLHDCWAFTGHCTHFSFAECEKWKSECNNCIQKRKYPASYVKDNSKQNFEEKKRIFTNVKNLKLITPSNWLAELVKKSFLKEYPVEVVRNKIDTDIFKPTPSNFRYRYKLESKRIILGVANVWNERKGYSDFLKLSKLIDDNFVIVLVGVSKKQMKKLPGNIIGIPRTESKKELAEIYTEADVFINPTYEDNYPTVNLEAQACGTPCITYNTGGSVETVSKNNVVKQGDICALLKAISTII